MHRHGKLILCKNLQQPFVDHESLSLVIVGGHSPSSETPTLHVVGVLLATTTATNTIIAIKEETKVLVEGIVFVCFFLTIMLRFTSMFYNVNRLLFYMNFVLKLFSMWTLVMRNENKELICVLLISLYVFSVEINNMFIYMFYMWVRNLLIR